MFSLKTAIQAHLPWIVKDAVKTGKSHKLCPYFPDSVYQFSWYETFSMQLNVQHVHTWVTGFFFLWVHFASYSGLSWSCCCSSSKSTKSHSYFSLACLLFQNSKKSVTTMCKCSNRVKEEVNKFMKQIKHLHWLLFCGLLFILTVWLTYFYWLPTRVHR